MSTHLDRHRAEMKRLAYPAVEQFVAQNPEYTISSDQSGTQSVTNYVILGHHVTQTEDEPVIFKYFCEDERKTREVYALRHFAATGLVPLLIAEDGPRLIVQSRIPGSGLPTPGASTFEAADANRAGYTLGQATATLMRVPLSAHAAQDFEQTFYDGVPLARYFREILDASWQVQQKVGAYDTALFSDSLTHIEAHLPYILQQPRLLYHQDALNMHFVNHEFAGFFDLEMCRVGTEAMQIGSLWYVFATYQNWPAFAQGFTATCGRRLSRQDFDAAKAFAHFLVWRYASRSGRWRGEIDAGADQAQIIDDANGYAKAIELNHQADNYF